MSGRSDRARTNSGKCPHDCMKPLPGGGVCRKMCMKTINHGTGRDEDGNPVPGGKMHDCGKH